MWTSGSRRSPSASASCLTSLRTPLNSLAGKQGAKISSTARSRRDATRMSCTRSMSRVSRTPSACANSSSARTGRCARPRAGTALAGSTSMSSALAMFVQRCVRQLEDHAFAQPAAADPERPAQARAGGVEHQYARGQQLGALGREAVAARHLGGRGRRTGRRARARARARRAPGRRGWAATRRCRRRRRRRRRAGSPRRRRRRARPPASSRGRRATADRRGSGRASALEPIGNECAHVTPPASVPTAISVDMPPTSTTAIVPRRRRRRACSSRRGTPAAPRRRPRARRPRRPPRRAARASSASRLAARRIAAVATTRTRSAPASAASRAVGGDDGRDLGDHRRRGSRPRRRSCARCA